jgi:hypothetical protein
MLSIIIICVYDELAYYWRANQIAGKTVEMPPKVLLFNEDVSYYEILKQLKKETYPRIVVHIKAASQRQESSNETQQRIAAWALDSVGVFEPYLVERERYRSLPYFSGGTTKRSIGACQNIFQPYRGNRSCFSVCTPPYDLREEGE